MARVSEEPMQVQKKSLTIGVNLSSKTELLRRSNPHYGTKIFTVELRDDQEFEEENASGTVYAKMVEKGMLKAGDIVVMKQFTDGPEMEKKAKAKAKCKNEFKKLKLLNGLLRVSNVSNKSLFVITLGIGEDNQSRDRGRFVLLEQGECSLGYLLHHRKDCPALTEELPEESQEDCMNHYSRDHCFTFIVQIFQALMFLHNEGMMHRDLKSFNVLLFGDKTLCKLCDFEDCREFNKNTAKTQMTAKMGTTWWRAPELYVGISLEGKTEYGPSADWYSFGLVMCEALFREEPFACFYTGSMSDRLLEPSRVYNDKFLSTLPGKDEVDSCAMYIDHKTRPGSPKVVLDKEKCVFPSVKDFERVWSFIDDLLRWKPEQRPSGDQLENRFFSDVACFSSGSPRKIIFAKNTGKEETTDTGARSNETVMSLKPINLYVRKVFLKAENQNIAQDKEAQTCIIDRIKDLMQAVLLILDTKPAPALHVTYLNPRDRFVVYILGEERCVNRVFEHCASPPFAAWITANHQTVPGLVFKVVQPN